MASSSAPAESGAVLRSPEEPPGLDRVRRFLARPLAVARFVWLWVRWIGIHLGRGLAVAGRSAYRGARIAQAAGAVAESVGKVGGRLDGMGQNWSRAGGRLGRVGGRLASAGRRMRAGGSRWADTARGAAGVGVALGELHEALTGEAPEGDKPIVPEPAVAPVPEALPEPVAKPRSKSGAKPGSEPRRGPSRASRSKRRAGASAKPPAGRLSAGRRVKPGRGASPPGRPAPAGGGGAGAHAVPAQPAAAPTDPTEPEREPERAAAAVAAEPRPAPRSSSGKSAEPGPVPGTIAAKAPAAGSGEPSRPSPDLPAHWPADLRAAIGGLGARIRSEELRRIIAGICAEGWTTDAELAAWLDRDERNLRKRHLLPMMEAGLLESRYPVGSRRTDQAYRVPPAPGG